MANFIIKIIALLAALSTTFAASTAQAKFLTADPVGYLDQLNLYAYVHNDPINHIDPDGRQAAVLSFPGTARAQHQSNVQQLKAVAIGGIAVASVFVPGPEDVILAGAGARALTTAARGTDFVVDANGTAVRGNAAGARAELDGAGFKGEPTPETAEVGSIHKGVPGKDAAMDVRVMDGQARGGPDKGPRVVTQRHETKEQIKTDGSKFRNNESKAERNEKSHIHLKKEEKSD
ncbi:MAG: RHS repeat-associated core domain-containing protein [Pseudomonadota bacterium]